jgi:hypothetical protein
MKVKASFTRKFIATIVLVQFGILSHGATFNVTSNADAGAGTLRQAILDINATALAAPHTITFTGLTTAALRTIDITSDLPVLTKPTIIDGYTTPTYAAGTPVLYLRGVNSGFIFTNSGANGSTIRGIIIDQCASYGINLSGVSNITIQGCWIGLTNGGGTPAAAVDKVNNHGIFVFNCSNITIGGTSATDRNVIGAVVQSGISIEGGSSNVTITGNYIGTDVGATAARTNGSHGINVVTASNITIGGTTTNHRNIIAGNTGSGINLSGATTATVMGNYIGIRNSTTALANGANGVNVLSSSSGVTIGGTTVNHRNIISGNTNTGVNVDITSHGTIIKANYIGTNSAGTAAIGNGAHGVYVNNSNNAIIGGSNAIERNVISGNVANGISLENSSGHIVKGNFLGTSANGLSSIPNNDSGLSMTNVTGLTIGGVTLMERNVISGNVKYGIYTSNFDNSTITGNYIGVDSTGNAKLKNNMHGVTTHVGSDNNIRQSNVVGGNGSAGTGNGFNIEGALNNTFYGNYVGIGINGNSNVGNLVQGIRIALSSNNNIIGGTGANQRNYVSANGNHAIFFDNGSSSNIVKSNYVGTDVTGLISRPNGAIGIFMFEGANNNIIGGAAANEGNLVAGSLATSDGIRIQISSNNVVYGNVIGLNSNGVASTGFGNTGNGIYILSYNYLSGAAGSNIIGGTAAGQANKISQNSLDGVRIESSAGAVGSNFNPILGNKIYCNGLMGINQNSNSSLENQGLAAPVITSRTATSISGTATIGNTIHLYTNTTSDGGVKCDCEGETLITSFVVPGTGNWSYTHNLGLTIANSMTATQTNASNSTSEFSSCASIPLPVDYLFFTAKKLSENSGLIEWATATEKNNHYFEVQRSYNGKDFATLETIEGNGTRNSLSSYSYVDNEIASSVVYYRLKQVDMDGQISYSDVRSIVFSEETISIINLGNHQPSIISHLEKEDEITYGIYTITGQQLFLESYTAGKGVFEKNISLPSIAPGIYFIKVFSNTKTISEKVNFK